MTSERDHPAGETATTTSSDSETVVRGERFAGGPARSFMSSLDADQRIFGADLAVDRGHTVMLAEQGIIGDADAAAILNALGSVEKAGHDALPDGEDVHEAIESAVVAEVGPVGGKMHTARSRNDEVATCIRYRFRQDLLAAAEATIDLRGMLLEAVAAETETVVPGFTHRQHAQPTTVGHLLCSYAGAVARDTERLLAAYERTNRSPLGSAAFAGTTFDVNRERAANLLGFHDVIENAADAVTARDFLVEGSAAFATLATTLSGLATDLIEGAKDGHVELDDAYASTSSIMPQKKNPDSLELVRAVAGAVATAKWDEAACTSDAGAGFSTATGVADALAAAGVPFRTAHELVAEAATSLDDAAMTDTDAQINALDAAAESVLDDTLAAYVDRETLSDLLSPSGSVAARDSRGGPATAAVEASLTRLRGTHADHAAAIDARREALADAEDRLAAEVNEYV